MDIMDSENIDGNSPRFQGVALPPPQELESYRRSFGQSPPPTDRRTPLYRHRQGAPTKLKTESIRDLNIRNTRGKKFKFSFIPQILVAHLQHLLGLKGKSRYNTYRWLRLYTTQGRSLAEYIKRAAEGEAALFAFKRIVSMKELKHWLMGRSYCEPLLIEEVSAKRIGVFRLFCVLKSIDLETQCCYDFNVREGGNGVWEVFREYILKTLWEELEIPVITEDEVSDTLSTMIS